MDKLRPPIPYSVNIADEILPVYPIPNNSDYNILRLSEDEIKRLEGTAAELRRLHSENQELVEALKSVHSICKSDLQYRQFPSSREYEIMNICEPLITKHKEQA